MERWRQQATGWSWTNQMFDSSQHSEGWCRQRLRALHGAKNFIWTGFSLERHCSDTFQGEPSSGPEDVNSENRKCKKVNAVWSMVVERTLILLLHSNICLYVWYYPMICAEYILVDSSKVVFCHIFTWLLCLVPYTVKWSKMLIDFHNSIILCKR